jgi:TRAP-type C4-dicarboxylate transport system permease large subunit
MAAPGRVLVGAAVAGTALWGGLVPALLLLAGAVAVQRATARGRGRAPHPGPAVAPSAAPAAGPAETRAALRRVATSVGWALAGWATLLLLLALDARAADPPGADAPALAAGTFVALLLPVVLLGGLVHGVRAARRAHGTTAASPAGR